VLVLGAKKGAGPSSFTAAWWLGQACCTVELKLAFVVSSWFVFFFGSAGMLF